jgi:DNA-binding NarL/FixJ family response regulator
VTDTPEPGTIRVLIADDQRVVREGLTMLVGLIDGVEVVGTACDGADGIAATADLRERLPAARVLVLTTYADQDAIVPALQAGARGYLTKDASAEQIETAIRAVHAGQTHLDPAVQERLVAAVISHPPPPDLSGPGRKPPDGLTAREVEVLALLASGLSNTEIAQRLYLTNATVKTHINRIFAKTGARDRAQAVRYAYQHRLAAG